MISVETVKARLATLGVTYETEDNLLNYIATAKHQYILNTCNLASLPAELGSKAIDLVCGEFIETKKNSGGDIGINIEAAVSSISEGDTSVDMALGKGDKTAEQRLDELIAFLKDESTLISFRKIRW